MFAYRMAARAFLEVARRLDPVLYARLLGVTVGDGCKLLSTNFGSEPYLVTLGNHVEVTHGVQFLTHDGGVWVLRGRHPDLDVIAPIVIEDNVFLGLNCIILPGITVGRSSIVGTGSVVTKNVEADTVVAGVPARRICSVAEYEQRVLPRNTHTKALSPGKKKRALKAMFRI